MLNWRIKASLILALVLLCHPALAQNGPFLPQLGKDIEARFLYPTGQHFEHETLFPLVLEYKNISSLPQEFNLDWAVDTPVPKEYKRLILEPGATKRLPFLFPPRMANQLYNISLNDQSLSPNVQGRSQGQIVGMLVPKGDSLDFLHSMQLEKNPYYSNNNNSGQDEEYSTLQALSNLDAEVFPTHWGALRSLSYLVCYDLQSMSLSTRQYQALVKWVQQGGQLIVVSNGLPTEYNGTPLQDILPFEGKDVVSQDQYVRLTGSVREGAEVGFGENDAPILISRDLIKGKVHFFTVPATASDILGKDQTRTIWRGLLANVNNNQHSGHAFTHSMLDDMPELPRAQAGWVALFVILYGIIVGPINLSLLRKKDKMLWSFVTVPVVAILFAGGAYVVNRVIRPSSPVLRELGWFHTVSGSSTGVIESEQLLFSPHGTTFVVQSDTTSLFDIHQTQYRSFSNSRQFGLYSLTPEGGLKAPLKMGTWDVQRFHAYAVSDLKGPIVASFNQEGKELTLNTPLPSQGATAILYHPVLGHSKAFQFESGSHTYDLDFSGNNRLDYPKDEKNPGRQDLADNVNSLITNNQALKADQTYLFFWTDELKTSLTLSSEGVLRHDFLISVEVEG